ncbi:1-phosphatidylinositol-3-phosphate 5-kinase [Ascosphaera aggregata]|nr:1-phosphatidylinositol-3-phosphate 5-kinase [Ascosphaera aggregata]
MNGPVAAAQVFIYELPKIEIGRRYNIETGHLRLDHQYPSPTIARVSVDVNSLVTTLTRSETDIGAWIEVIGKSRRDFIWLLRDALLSPVGLLLMHQYKNHEASSPSASSIFLPLGRRPRRGSQTSANTQIEKDKLTEALNKIHSAASRSNELTVFNDFTTPPSPEPAEDKGPASGGLSGLYQRFFKTSLDGVKDIVGGQTKQPGDMQETQSSNPKPATILENDSKRMQPSGDSGTGRLPNDGSPMNSGNDPSSGLSLSALSPSGSGNPQLGDTQLLKSLPKSPSASSKTSTPLASNHRSQSLPLNKVPPPTTAVPSTTQVNVSAFAQRSIDPCSDCGAFPIHPDDLSIAPHSQDASYFTLDKPILSPEIISSPKIVSKDICLPNTPSCSQSTDLPCLCASDMLPSRPSSPYAAMDIEGSKQALGGIVTGTLWSATWSVKPPPSDVASGSQTPTVKMMLGDDSQDGGGSSRQQTSQSIPVRTSLGVHASQNTTPRSTPGARPIDCLRRLKIPNNEVPPIASKLLGREFWMRDENAKDCFHCGEPFTTFRRKHHCRTCGQIFCSKCTCLISGASFAQNGTIRVCKPCEVKILAYEDDSSDYSVDDLNSAVTRTKSFDRSPSVNPAPSIHEADDDDASSVAMSITRRALDSANRRSTDFDPGQLSRPNSSRSLKSTMGGRSRSLHRRHHSRPQFIRNFRAYHDDSAPFQRRIVEEMNSRSKFSAFHRDSIIDPELTQYLSDGDYSEDAQSMVSDLEAQNLLKDSEPDKLSFGNILAAVKNRRSRFGDKGNKIGEDLTVLSGKSTPRLIATKRSSQLNPQRLSPRLSRELPGPFSRNYDVSHQMLASPINGPSGGYKMTRSSSMRGASAPALVLNKASSEHVRKLLRQLLDGAAVAHAHSWQSAMMPILLKVVDDVDPDVQQGDDMDARHYVKLKRIPGGQPGDTSYVSGLVFTKNLALKSMPRQIPRPRILLIAFALEYARQEQHFMSLEPVIRQECEFLENLVSRISAFRPTLLLVEKTVSGRALELLSEAGIATAYNVRPSVMEAVSRCTRAKIITSMDRLAAVTDPVGECGTFEVKTYVHDGYKKTYMYLYGCSPELGCTIVLRGAGLATLAKIKRIAEFMIYVVYNLKLETCLMRDEFAKILNPNQEKLVSTREPTHTNPEEKQHGNDASDESEPSFYEDMVRYFQTTILSVSPYVKFKPPYLLMRARELEQRLSNWKRLRNQDSEKLNDKTADEYKPQDEKQEVEKMKSKKFLMVTPEMVHETLAGASLKQREVLHAVHNAEYERAYLNYQSQKRQWENYISGNINMFDPYAHQNIVVLYSVLNTKTFAPCVGPEVFTFGFYDEHENDALFEADCTLGQYVEHLCECAHVPCEGGACEEPMMNHHRRYVHGEAQIRVYVEPHPSKLRGLENIILMWNCCKICKSETPAICMSKNTWRYSFAKYLELSFWSEPIHPRAGFCNHDLHRDHLRYFGYKDIAVCITYDSIDLLDLNVPSLRVTWKVELDLKLRNDVYTKAERRLHRFFGSVKARLDGINVDNVAPEKLDACRQEIVRLKQKASEDFSTLLRQHQEQYMTSKYWEIIPLNRMIRSVQEKVVEWDSLFTEIEKNYFPSEKDIRRLATLQLKRFLDRGVSVSPGEENLHTPPEMDEKNENHDMTERRMTRRLTLTPQQAKDVLVSVVEEDSGIVSTEKQSESPKPTPPIPIIGERRSETIDLHSTAATPESFSSSVSPGQFSSAHSPGHHEASTKGCDTPSILQGVSPSEAPSRAQSRSQQHEDHMTSASSETAQNTLDRMASKSPEPKITYKAESYPGDSHLVGFTSITPPLQRTSAIPRPQEKARKLQGGVSPPLRRSPQPGERGTAHAILHRTGGGVTSSPNRSPTPRVGERKHLENPAAAGVKTAKFAPGHSMIPRSVTSSKRPTRVSNLARHFEQLSREFEKERQRERQQRANSIRLSRAIPTRSSNPIVQVYKNVRDAVERDPSEEDDMINDDHMDTIAEEPPASMPAEIPETLRSPSRGQTIDIATVETSATAPALDQQPDERLQKDDDARLEQPENDPDHPPEEDKEDEIVYSDDDKQEEELPKHERMSLIKMLTNFWAERSSSGWSPLDYPLSTLDHVFEDCDIIVREDEPSSLIAFALDSEDYKQKLAACTSAGEETGNVDEQRLDEADIACEDSLLRETGTHLKYQFQESQAQMTCKIFYAEQFDALRRKCGVSHRIVESLSRCMKWDSQGGKSQSLFLKTTDQRFILKSLSPMESTAFLKFAPGYFSIMSEVLFHELPSAIAKMFGFYQVIIKNPATDVDFDCYLLLMENLFYDRTPTRIFDLKGSMRNRKVESTGKRDEVLLDENMVEFIFENPLFTRSHSKKLLNQSVWNDTLFLVRQNVMDYSLMLAIDGPKKEVVVGIIDCIRTYTWDKKVESWIKGGGKNRPTIMGPREYKNRFRQAMARYVLHAPDTWYHFQPAPMQRPQQGSRTVTEDDKNVEGT